MAKDIMTVAVFAAHKRDIDAFKQVEGLHCIFPERKQDVEGIIFEGVIEVGYWKKSKGAEGKKEAFKYLREVQADLFTEGF